MIKETNKNNKTVPLHINTDPLGIVFYDEGLTATHQPSPFPSPSSSSSSTIHYLKRTDSFRNKCQLYRRPNSNTTCINSKSWESIKSPAASFLANFSFSPASVQIENEQDGDEIDDYVLDKMIGHGGFSTVRLGFRISDGQKVAIKIIKRTSSSLDELRLERELSIWKNLNHPNIVKLEKVLETDSAFFLVSEYCSGGNLLSRLLHDHQENKGRSSSSIEETTMIKSIFIDLCKALYYLHEEVKVCHKDLKLENILLDQDGRAKLCDFGLAIYQQPSITTHINTIPLSPECVQDDLDCAAGSLAYAAPEQIKSKRAIACPSTDIWSLGVILYALITGRLPFADEFELRLQQKILEGQYEMPTTISPELQDLIRNCLSVNPDTRFTIHQVLQSSWCSSMLT
ncbi:kinase-like domain-containing protein [Cokeromyces recurvatus]|uniref:kinase-like domain-containing protein n=1 Tax=Cokeromyces recurvatus TaxID=90255 RepID=UPI002220FC0B|nr:kinase-like domain-containing protein [Cokeromyces recurvatus]KAI7905190.1 kinase-like domain-containing protein [Cokeromyces recurvatus]